MTVQLSVTIACCSWETCPSANAGARECSRELPSRFGVPHADRPAIGSPADWDIGE